MSAYLTMTSGARTGSNYRLDEQDENRIGRGLDCQIVLSDPRSSRVHAVVFSNRDGWWVRDEGSSNGTYINGQKIDEARLADGCKLGIGDTEFAFTSGKPPSALLETQHADLTETIVVDTAISPADTGNFAVAAFQEPERARDMLDLYQLTITLLGCSDPDEVVRVSLELLQQRSQATLAGFLWTSDSGQLKPKMVEPQETAGHLKLSETLTKLVVDEGRAIRVNQHSGHAAADSLRAFAEAICVPLISDGVTLGAIHLYRQRGGFRQTDFEVAVSVANILVVALAKARRFATLQADHNRLIQESADGDELIGDSPPMVELKKKLGRVARAAGCVLVRGESGCGKELVARALHKSSPRGDRPMLSVNCAAIARNLIESQLFGHKKGSFTGADADHTGWFQQADSGTLFLDEVGELTLEGQAKLLRILEGHPFLPVGGQQEVCVDVRVIAATNRDLREFVGEGRFREDLYYRLSVFELCVPPLRERGADIERLIDFFLDHFRRRHGRPELELTPAARQKLLAYQWPGNVRQLRNVIDSAVVLADDQTIQSDDLGLRDVGAGELQTLRIDDWEQKLIREALSRTGGNIPEAAQLLGIGRATLYRKVDEYGIPR